jgi:hypothetical protein
MPFNLEPDRFDVRTRALVPAFLAADGPVPNRRSGVLARCADVPFGRVLVRAKAAIYLVVLRKDSTRRIASTRASASPGLRAHTVIS